MQGTDRVYERPSRLSQGLVVCLSIAVVLMAGWLAVTIMSSRDATTAAERNSDIMTSVRIAEPADATAVSGEPDAPRTTARVYSVHFDWPEEFMSATATPARTALPLGLATEPSPAATQDFGHLSRTIATAVQDPSRSIPARQPLPAKAATEGDDAIVDVLSPSPFAGVEEGKETAAAAVPMPRRRPRVEREAQPGPDQSMFELPTDRQR